MQEKHKQGKQSGELSRCLRRHIPNSCAVATELPDCRGLSLYLLNEDYPQHELTPEQTLSILRYPAYWAFCWASGVVLARYLLDNPEWVVPAASPEKLADKLDAMLSLPAVEREVLGQVSVSRISEHFTMDKISRRYYDLYTSVIDSK